jgi:hypothetical protein
LHGVAGVHACAHEQWRAFAALDQFAPALDFGDHRQRSGKGDAVQRRRSNEHQTAQQEIAFHRGPTWSGST